ncbi:MAG: ABC transporter permease subunit [Gemmatimonadales bacterium]|uniref:ABC transporter permease n=1 Tax=Candidatus Palauibacter irciniicola TaxID=3056733 RepID=UPI00138372F7|nr:ABC transporter permease subunit [Candidatus Palauibacter irciniicola]MYC17383.1 ABC transporter permease subunit [Gemmatimonadales bacterium]
MDPLLEALRLITSGDLYVWNVILRSLQISGSALLLAMVIGLPIGIAVGLTRFRLRLPLVAVINAGLAFPPVVVGLGVFLVLSRAGPLGDLQLLYTPAAMIGAQAILAGPYIAAVSLAAVENIPRDISLQARALGASRWQAIVLQLREVRTSLVAAVAAGFGAIISEVGAVMMVGGNILGETRVMTTAIVLETRRGNFDVAIAMGIVLMLIALCVNAVLLLLGRRTIRRGQAA